ncbi:hypothetical protein CONLIGDRAFT_634773 [Coniochaeta ligniaria NRRL 30616]|uniref:Uncharacterized protein n=1 Tax=Coniochaeta ligniaria NRRL 30616 TaxID=1408157 RepID=A0A1J7IGH8_9PEZI|nr:hypothetical protein CONLIGDRAFT_634773 [Coniochaeta ligniaria NRRL 30616]
MLLTVVGRRSLASLLLLFWRSRKHGRLQNAMLTKMENPSAHHPHEPDWYTQSLRLTRSEQSTTPTRKHARDRTRQLLPSQSSTPSARCRFCEPCRVCH